MARHRYTAASLEPVPNVIRSRLRLAAPAVLLAAFLASLACAPATMALGLPTLQSKARSAMKKAGAGSGALIRDLNTGQVLFEHRSTVDRVPASVEKLYTTAAALRRIGPSTRLNTDVLASGTVDDQGRLAGSLFLLGGGDPTLGTDDMVTLAERVGNAGIRQVTGSVIGDESRFDTRRGNTGWGYSPWLGGSLSALTVGRGWGDGGPGLSAARTLARALRAQDIRVAGKTGTGRAPAGSRRVARVSSPTVAELARLTNAPSDNFLAETLLKELGARFGGSGTTAAGASVARGVAAGFGARPKIADGSGLSRANASSPRDVVSLITGIRGTPIGDEFEGSLALAGRTGTLASRMRGTAAAGNCRAKTGTLSNVSSLAGTCRTASGHTVVFALLMNYVAPYRGRSLQDSVAVAIARYDG